MSTFHFTGHITHNGVTTESHTVTVEMANVLHAALEAGHRIRVHFAEKGGMEGHLTCARVDAPATDEYAATRDQGRRMGMTEAQIERFIARMV